MTEGTELALRTALNVLRDSIETGRMPSGLRLGAEALAMHAAAIAECERLLATLPGGAQQTDPDEIKLVQALRQLSSHERIEFLQLLRAIAHHAPAHELRAAALRLARARGIEETAVIRAMDALLRPHAAR